MILHMIKDIQVDRLISMNEDQLIDHIIGLQNTRELVSIKKSTHSYLLSENSIQIKNKLESILLLVEARLKNIKEDVDTETSKFTPLTAQDIIEVLELL